MFAIHNNESYKEVAPGIRMKILCSGEQMNMVEFILEKGSVLPEHKHENEQTGYLVKGKIRLFIGNDSKVLGPGDSWSIKSNEPHKAEILENSIAVEVFNPKRNY